MIPLLIAFGVMMSAVIYMVLRRAQWRQDQIFRERRERMAEARKRSTMDPSQLNPDFIFDDSQPR